MQRESRSRLPRLGLVSALVCLALVVLGGIQPAMAFTPVVNNAYNHGCGAVASCAVSPTITAKGDLIVGSYSISGTAGQSGFTYAFSSTNAEVWTVVATLGPFTCAAAGNVNCWIAIAEAVALGSGAYTVTVTTTGGSPAGGYEVDALDVGPANTFNSVGQSCSGSATSGTLLSCAGSVSFSTDGILVGQQYDPGATVSYSAGFTANSRNFYSAQAAGTGVPTPTSFPATGSVSFYWGIVGVFLSFAQVAVNQQQTIGSCPTKNTNTFTMVNSTLYFYYGTSPGSSTVNTISVGISSVGGSTGTHSLGFYIYAATTPGAIGASNPLNQVYGVIKAFTSGTTHSVYTLQVAAPLIGSGVTWGVAIVGDNKIAINQSSLSGIYTVAGVASTAAQAASFTSQGTSVGTELDLCATAQYASSATTTVTSVSTTTSISTTGTPAGASVFLSNANLPITILFLVGPALFFAAVTRNIVGMVLGLATGALILVIVGAVDRYLFAALIVGLIAIAFIARSRDN